MVGHWAAGGVLTSILARTVSSSPATSPAAAIRKVASTARTACLTAGTAAGDTLSSRAPSPISRLMASYHKFASPTRVTPGLGAHRRGRLHRVVVEPSVVEPEGNELDVAVLGQLPDGRDGAQQEADLPAPAPPRLRAIRGTSESAPCHRSRAGAVTE